MIRRRSLLSMLGLAPIAATVPINDTVYQNDMVMPTSSAPTQFNNVENVSQLEWEKRRVAALRWAAKNGVAQDVGLLAEDATEAEVSTMRSWSPQHRQRVTQQRREKLYRERQMATALARVEREIKLSMAPEWVRRYLI